jgi:23S rRNA (adenine2503-C2)-methyltransferase
MLSAPNDTGRTGNSMRTGLQIIGAAAGARVFHVSILFKDWSGMSSSATLNDNLLGLDRVELERLAAESGQPAYRGRQIYRAIYMRRQRDFAGLTDLEKVFRENLASRYRIAYPEVCARYASQDGSVRYLFSLEDGERVETVYMPEADRVTLCLSSQVGCAVDCRFCFTALLGVKRNLTAGEMVGQVLAVLADQSVPRGRRVNIVFMGMGEPMLNLPQVMKAVGILADPDGVGIPWRRITVSTAGIIPGIRQMALENVRPKLAVSLNASTDEQRTTLMPINKKYPLAELMRACREYPLRPRERMTFEYVMLEGVNDSDDDAVRVAKLLEGIRAKLNLIPYNPGDELTFRPSPLARVVAFESVLRARDIPAFIRISRGRDVCGACGQLKLAETPPERHQLSAP